MSRSANSVASIIFERLITYAADHATPVLPGDRYIFLSEPEYDFLVNTRRTGHLKFGRHQAAALISSPEGEFIALAGFDAEEITQSSHMREIDPSDGMLVACIADLEIDPPAVPAAVRNVVGAGRKGDKDYRGHDLADMLGLFPSMRVIEVDEDARGPENFLPNLLAACAREGASGNGWMSTTLADELELLGTQRIVGLPYEFLARAVLDLNPTNLFLSLYRCLEATYAFTKASEFSKTLDLEKPWTEVARALGKTLSWYPRHDQSLVSVLTMPTVDQSDLAAVANVFAKSATPDTAPASAASGIRELRNSLVHYGPTTPSIALKDDAWNELCIPLSRIVGGVFLHAYASLRASGDSELLEVGHEAVWEAPREQPARTRPRSVWSRLFRR